MTSEIEKRPMNLLFTKEWLMKKIAEDPDNLSCEAGVMHPEAPRFFIDHGVIHDKLTGKHVRTDEFEDGIEGALELLNSMHAALVESVHGQYRAVFELTTLRERLRAAEEALRPFVAAFNRVAPTNVAHNRAGNEIMETLKVKRGACLDARSALAAYDASHKQGEG